MPEEVKQHLAKLESILKSDELGIDGRLFVHKEIWDINHEQTKKAATAMATN